MHLCVFMRQLRNHKKCSIRYTANSPQGRACLPEKAAQWLVAQGKVRNAGLGEPESFRRPEQESCNLKYDLAAGTSQNGAQETAGKKRWKLDQSWSWLYVCMFEVANPVPRSPKRKNPQLLPGRDLGLVQECDHCLRPPPTYGASACGVRSPFCHRVPCL